MFDFITSLFKNRSKGPIRAFLSYSTDDKVLAGKIKYTLEAFWNFDIFLAHEDLDPSVEWESEILRNLHNCELFMPLISPNFHKSKWTDQESGIAFNKSKVILPICTPDNPPYGFLNQYQAFFYHEVGDHIGQMTSLIERLGARNGFKRRIIDGAIFSLENSRSYEMTRGLCKFLKKHLDSISKEDFKRIKLAGENNGQVKDEVYHFPGFISSVQKKFTK